MHEMLAGKVLEEAFSQEKDEIVLVFQSLEDGSQSLIKAVLHADFSCLSFPEKFERARKNSVNLFNEFQGKAVTNINIFENERAIHVDFEDHTALVFKLFGNRSNLLALDTEGKVTQLFSNRLALDWELSATSLNRKIDQSEEAFESAGYDYRKLYPTLGKLANAHLDALLATSGPHMRWQVVQRFISEIENPPYYVTRVAGLPALTLFETGEVISVFEDPVAALNAFYLAHIRLTGIEKEKAEIVRLLKKRIQQTANYLENTFEKLVSLESAVKNDEIGNLIMAHMHAIPARVTEVEVFDFYRDQPIRIKLKKDLSPQKNAEAYYRKAKNEKIEISRLNDSLSARELEKAALEDHLAHIETIVSLRELRTYIKTNQLNQAKVPETTQELFKKVDFMGYTILIGRNAKNNDLLTRQYAHKDDLWLHAKDVTGSHVVVKNQPGKNMPALVIERAAELAAWYSKRRNDTLCPVIYTPRKFVRKPKGLPEGAVIIEKENVILVPAKGE
ncbi:NFACT RNA binding domain-containing protein [Dyadobacter sandarakinus]|nr:NFACT RNA binding domain-containing protein [Dyadobacter sandarakinus]